MKQRLPTFMAVGAAGFLVQITALAWLSALADWSYVPATAVAVELAVVHNFWWHERWTWGTPSGGRPGVFGRLARFHVTTGLTSVAGNIVLTSVFVESLGFAPIAANALAVVLMSVANFLVADRWVFGALRP